MNSFVSFHARLQKGYRKDIIWYDLNTHYPDKIARRTRRGNGVSFYPLPHSSSGLWCASIMVPM